MEPRPYRARPPSGSGVDVTVIIPAYNEAASVVDTIKSLQGADHAARRDHRRGRLLDRRTGDVARVLGVVGGPTADEHAAPRQALKISDSATSVRR